MTTPEDRYKALKQSRKLLEELCDPGKTPRVPSIVRDRARSVLKHYPSDYELERIVENCPDLLEKTSYNDKVLKIVR